MIFLLICAATLTAQNVTILYLDKSETNLEAGSFIKEEAKSQNQDITIKYAAGFKKLKGNEKIVVLLNSGLSSGIDPRIETFINSSNKKDSLILVNLYSKGNAVFVEVTEKFDSLVGVDEISAASQYRKSSGGFFSKSKVNPVLEMHKEWTAKLFALIQDRL